MSKLLKLLAFSAALLLISIPAIAFTPADEDITYMGTYHLVSVTGATAQKIAEKYPNADVVVFQEDMVIAMIDPSAKTKDGEKDVKLIGMCEFLVVKGKSAIEGVKAYNGNHLYIDMDKMVVMYFDTGKELDI